MIDRDRSRSDIENFLIKLYDILDATEDKYYSASIAKSLKGFSNEEFKKVITQLAKDGVRFIAAPFNSPSVDQINEAAKFLNIKLKERMRLPEIDPSCITQKEVSWGIMYIQKLEHISELKEHARNVGPYIKTTLEPTRGKSRAGGQRLGELDTWCLLAYDAHTVLRDLLTISGDNPDAKRKVLSDIYAKGYADVDPKALSRSGAGQMLDAILIAMGIDPNA
jgi:DNA-directed RNA polymerase subunit beta